MSRMRAIALLPLVGLPFYGCLDNPYNGEGKVVAAKDSSSARSTPVPWRELAKEMKQGDTVFIPIDSTKPRPQVIDTAHSAKQKKLDKGATGQDTWMKVCSDINYTGTCWLIHVDDYYNNLNYALNGFNDAISSIQISNTTVKPYFCVDSDWRGSCIQFTSDVPDLRVYNFNDVITSIKWQQTGSIGVTVYEDANYGGRAYTLIIPFDYNELPDWTDNRVSSYKVWNGTPIFNSAVEWVGSNWFAGANEWLPSIGSGWNDNFSSVYWVNKPDSWIVQ